MENEKVTAIYIRLSDEDGDLDGQVKTESNSITAQRSLVLSYISGREEFKGCKIKEYADDGYSGMGFERPQFIQMMSDAKKGKINTIIVKDFSRFGRDHLEVGNFLEKIFPLLNIRFISVNDNFDSINCHGMTGGMGVALKNILNAMYSRDLSIKVKTAMSARAANGEYMPAFAAYGYRKKPDDKHKLVIDAEAAEIVKLIFTMAADGKTKGAICRYLNKNHVATPAEHMRGNGINIVTFHEKETKLWSVTSISDMLKNEIYLGKTVWNKSGRTQDGTGKKIKYSRSMWKVVEGTHEPIVSQELFDKANQKAFTHVPKKKGQKKIMPLVMCPYCGRHMMRGDKYHHNYRCSMAGISGIPECAGNKICKETLETLIINCTKEMAGFMSASLVRKKKQWAESSITEKELEKLKNEKARLSAKKFTIYDSYRNGDTSREDYLCSLEKIRERLAEIGNIMPELEQKIREAEEQAEAAGTKENGLADIAALQDFNKETLSKVIDKVYVYGPDKVEIIWKTDDIFFNGEMPEKKKVVNPEEIPLAGK